MSFRLRLPDFIRCHRSPLAIGDEACTIFACRNVFFALLLLATPVLAQQRPTAYEAMRTVGKQLKRDFVNHVIEVSGTNGDPQPATWKILLDDPQARGGVREVEVGNGQIVSERTPLRSSVESSLGPVIDTAKLNLDSSGAYTLARQTAQKSHVNFATVDYTLRVDQRGNPIWMVALLRQNGEQAGKDLHRRESRHGHPHGRALLRWRPDRDDGRAKRRAQSRRSQWRPKPGDARFSPGGGRREAHVFQGATLVRRFL